RTRAGIILRFHRSWCGLLQSPGRRNDRRLARRAVVLRLEGIRIPGQGRPGPLLRRPIHARTKPDVDPLTRKLHTMHWPLTHPLPMNRALFVILIVIVILLPLMRLRLRLRLRLGLPEGSRALGATKIRGSLSMNRRQWPMINEQ